MFLSSSLEIYSRVRIKNTNNKKPLRTQAALERLLSVTLRRHWLVSGPGLAFQMTHRTPAARIHCCGGDEYRSNPPPCKHRGGLHSRALLVLVVCACTHT